MLHLSTKHLNNDDLARLQAPGRTNFVPVPSLPGVPSNANPGNCSSCGNDYAEGARFCRDCGLAKPSQAALVSVRNEVPRSEIKRNVSFGPTSVSDLSAQASQALPNAPPRLIARLQELELDSLLALCERLEGRLSKPKRSNRIKASEAELDDLCESLVDPDATPSPQTRQQQQQQQQLRYLTQLREAKQAAAEGFGPPPTSTTRPILRSDAPAPAIQAPTPSPSPSTQVPSTSVGTSPEPPDGQKSIPASKQEVLDALLLELNELLEKAPAQNQLPAASPSGPSLCGSPTPKPEPSPKPAKAGAIANSAGPLPVEEQAILKPAKPSAAFLDTVSMLQDGLRTLVERFSDEVAQASAELKAENERLLAEIAELRMQPRDPVTILSAPQRMEAESPAEAILGPAEAETPMAMATRMQPELAVRFQAQEQRIDIPGGPPEQAPECPDLEPPEAEGREGRDEGSGGGSLPSFAARSQWVQELQPGQADWGENAEEFEKATRPLRCSCVCLHELSRKRMLWDLLGLLLLIYDLVMTPWQVAFGQVGTVSEVMTWVLPVYWAINIFMTLFCTSFSSGGVLHSNRKAMVWRYLTQGFLLLDLLTTLLDLAVLTTFYDLTQSAYQSLRSLVLNKDVYLAIQAARLLRSVRVSRNLLGVRARIRSELWRALGTMAFSTLLLLIGAHIIACALYYLGSATGGNENTWLLEYSQIQQQEDSISMYLSALLWALAQLTPGLGPSPVNPKSVPDMILSTTVHVLALLACISLFAQGGMLVMRLRDARGEWANRQLACRAYLNTCKSSGARVPQRLQCHILSWLELEPEPRKAMAPGPRFLGWCGPRSLGFDAWHPWLPSESRSPLALLPPLIQQELLQELAAPFLSLHPFFHELDVAHPQALRQVIDCFQQFFYSPMQPIFRALTNASKLHMVTRGSATYLLDPASRAGASKRLSRAPVKVKLGQHISEGGLWLEAWQHQGVLTADGIEDASCEVLVLDEQSFGHLLRRSPGELWQAAASYARAYAKRAGERVTLTDLDGDLESLVKITDEAFADALRYLAHEAEQDPTGEAIGPASP